VVFFGRRYNSSFNSAARFSGCKKLLESIKKSFEKRRKSVGYKMSPTEIEGRRKG
jgi:hypothetical protein